MIIAKTLLVALEVSLSIYINGQGHMTKMATMAINIKNL